MGRGWGGGSLGLVRGVRSRSFVFRFCHDQVSFAWRSGCSALLMGVFWSGRRHVYTKIRLGVFGPLLCVTDIAFHFLAELVNEFWFLVPWCSLVELQHGIC